MNDLVEFETLALLASTLNVPRVAVVPDVTRMMNDVHQKARTAHSRVFEPACVCTLTSATASDHGIRFAHFHAAQGLTEQQP